MLHTFKWKRTLYFRKLLRKAFDLSLSRICTLGVTGIKIDFSGDKKKPNQNPQTYTNPSSLLSRIQCSDLSGKILISKISESIFSLGSCPEFNAKFTCS